MAPLRLAKLLLLLLTAAGIAWFGWHWLKQPWRPSAPAVVEPRLALEALRGPGTYANRPALEWLERHKPALLPSKEEQRRYVQATQDPQLFRKLDRERRFDEVWLLGEPNSYKPLLDHLLETKDFTLTHIDHTSLLFRRGGEPWSERELEKVTGSFQNPRERAYAQAQAATKLVAVRQAEPALKLLRSAEDVADVCEVWSAWSTLWMTKGQWDRALEAAEKALAIDPDFIPAVACRAQFYYASKRFFEAWKEAERLLAAQPEDPATLFYHAKLAHEARAFQSEISSLHKLIALAEKAGASASGYRVYLAQAYVGVNDADNAMDQVTLALLDTGLPREQRQFADELLQQVKRAMDGK